jgi:N-acetyl-anhydromuramyl-L-alanine amidase AmpD
MIPHHERKIDKIIIHCSATTPTMNIGADEIREWHTSPDPRDPSKPWSDIGYHDVIRRDGRVEQGRSIEKIGSHCKGHNAHSVGICLIGGLDDNLRPENNFTPEQWKSLVRLVRFYKVQYKKATVHGHREFDSSKACPSFDVQEWLKSVNV